MKKIAVCFVILCFTLFVGTTNVYSQTGKIEDLQKSVAAFSSTMAESLPFNASLGLNWSDAYIGKVFPSVPPHFGVGGSVGFTTMKMGSMKEIAGFLGYSIPIDMDRLLFPAYAAEVRIGGLFFPFDVGLKYGTLSGLGWGTSLDMSYTMFGVDVRYAVMEGNLILPKISIGIGYNYLDGGIWGKAGNGMTIEAGGESFGISAPKVGLLWNTSTLELKAQVSKSFFFVTPYAGLGASYAWSDAGYEVKTTVTGNTADVNSYLKQQGLESIDFNNSGFSSIISVNDFGLRTFLGASFNIVLFKVDLNFMFNLLDQNWGSSLGFRFQL